jgi:hypothetical protein
METILAIDPGFHLGFVQVQFDPDRKTVQLQGAGTTIGTENILEFIANSRADIYVVEDYKIRPANNQTKAERRRYEHQWDSGDTMRYIGMVQSRAHALGAEFVLQQPACKPAGYGWMGKTYVKGRRDGLVHQDDATSHLCFYLVKNRGCPQDILKRH